jgi:nucleoprotein TPR
MEMNSTYDMYKVEMETKIDEFKSKLDESEKKCAELDESLSKSQKEVETLQSSLASFAAEREKEMQATLEQLRVGKQSESEALQNCSQLKVDVKQHAQLAQAAQEKYEREVVSHSASLQRVNALKAAQAELMQKVQNAELTATVSQSSLESQKKSYDGIIVKLNEQVTALEARVTDLVSQNNLLHSQFEQISTSKKQQLQSTMEEMGSVEGGDLKTVKFTELTEVIKYLRREKDIIETKLQLSTHESERVQTQIEHLKKSFDETRLLLDEERKRSGQSVGSEKVHKDLLERIEQANLLRIYNLRQVNQM